jgi:acetyl-CoA C-acetyltransferase
LRRPTLDRLDPSTPVLMGVGAVHGDGDGASGGPGAVDLMAAAARAAGRDCEAGDLLGSVSAVSVPRGTWDLADPGRLVAQRIGCPSARTTLAELGIPQQSLITGAFEMARADPAAVVLVVGAEATTKRRLPETPGGPSTPSADGERPNRHLKPQGTMVTPAEVDVGLAVPVRAYALIDSAWRRARGRGLVEHRNEVAALWAGFNAAAAGRPEAAFPGPRDPGFLRDPGPENRPMAFPYNRWHCSQMYVDQGAALLATSLGRARRLGVDPERLVFPLASLESSFGLPLTLRSRLDRWPGMEVLGAAAASHTGSAVAELDHLEVYSCFPSAVLVQQDALGLSLSVAPTFTGGMTFAGGPFNNFVLQATAALVGRLRSSRGSRGGVTTVSGFLHKPGLAIYSSDPPDREPLLADLANAAEQASASVPLASDHQGPGEVIAYTVTYDGYQPDTVIALIATSEGRCLASCRRADLAQQAVDNDLGGATVRVNGSSLQF